MRAYSAVRARVWAEAAATSRIKAEIDFMATSGVNLDGPSAARGFCIESTFGLSAGDLVGDVRGGAHFADVMHADDVAAGEDGGGDGSGGGEAILFGVGMSEEALARGPGHQGEVQFRKFVQLGE